jgi:hypothetical protein
MSLEFFIDIIVSVLLHTADIKFNRTSFSASQTKHVEGFTSFDCLLDIRIFEQFVLHSVIFLL